MLKSSHTNVHQFAMTQSKYIKSSNIQFSCYITLEFNFLSKLILLLKFQVFPSLTLVEENLSVLFEYLTRCYLLISSPVEYSMRTNLNMGGHVEYWIHKLFLSRCYLYNIFQVWEQYVTWELRQEPQLLYSHTIIECRIILNQQTEQVKH